MRKERRVPARRSRVNAPTARPGARTAANRAGRKDLIALDTQSIRRKALQSHRQAERGLAKLTEQLQRFHERDLPGFRSWVHRMFGSLMTRQRDLEHTLEARQAFVMEIQTIARRYELSDLAAYRKVLWRRAHPEEAQAEDRQFEEAQRQRRESSTGDDGTNGMFGDVGPSFDDLFHDEDPWGSAPEDEWSDPLDKDFGTPPGRGAAARQNAGSLPDQRSVKELYRTIVRQLHPDHHGQMSEARRNLWHEAQEAYRRHDLNALHRIAARCSDGEAGLGDHSPVSLIHRLTRQLKAAAQSARHEVRDMQRNMAWDYETRIKSPRFVRQVESDLKDMVDSLQWTLDDLERELARLDRLAARQAQRGRPSAGKPARPSRAAGQDDFLF